MRAIAALLTAIVTLLVGCTGSPGYNPVVGGGVPVHLTLSELSGVDGVVRRAPCDEVKLTSNLAGPDEIANYFGTSPPFAIPIRCHAATRTYPGEGEWHLLIRQVATHTLGMRALVKALERPDDPPSHGACPAIGYLLLPILFTDGGNIFVHPRMPQDPCGGPQDALKRALKRLAWRTVAVEHVAVIRSPKSVAGGCSMQWKNEIRMLEPMIVKPSPGGPVFSQGSSTKRNVCIYRTSSDPDNGEFVRAVQLTGAHGHDLDAAVTGRGPSGECSAQKEFAVVFGPGHWLNVELGGCWRVLRDDNGAERFGSADAVSLHRLLGIN